MHSWTQIDGLLNLAVGTHLKLWLYQLGSFYDLTPVQNSGTSADSFYTTTSGSNAVGVAITSHGASTGDFYEALTSASGGGVTISGEYQVAVIDVNHFTIAAANNATSTASFGGGVDWQLLLSIGQQDTIFEQGYGSGPYGNGPFGESIGSGYAVLCRLWFVDNWGEFLLACPQNGAIYQWEPSMHDDARRRYRDGADGNAHPVALPQQQVVAFGSNQGRASKIRCWWRSPMSATIRTGRHPPPTRPAPTGCRAARALSVRWARRWRSCCGRMKASGSCSMLGYPSSTVSLKLASVAA